MSEQRVIDICPFCHAKAMELSEEEREIPYFGKVYMMSMSCSSCNFYKADIEAAEEQDPCQLTFVSENQEDLKVRVVKSSQAVVKIPTLRMSVEPGSTSIGYISNIEGLLRRFKRIVEQERDASDEKDTKTKCKNLLKKIWKIECGELPMKIVIEDPSGNSAIISEKTEIKKLKKKKK
jgi:zinc finger protein